jgi:hypothetical protein
VCPLSVVELAPRGQRFLPSTFWIVMIVFRCQCRAGVASFSHVRLAPWARLGSPSRRRERSRPRWVYDLFQQRSGRRLSRGSSTGQAPRSLPRPQGRCKTCDGWVRRPGRTVRLIALRRWQQAVDGGQAAANDAALSDNLYSDGKGPTALQVARRRAGGEQQWCILTAGGLTRKLSRRVCVRCAAALATHDHDGPDGRDTDARVSHVCV